MATTVFRAILEWIRSSYLDPSLRMLKVRAAIYYLEGVRGTHRILILVCLLVFVITLIGAGLVLVPLSLLLFSPWDPGTRALVGIVIGVIYILVATAVLFSLLSEKRWMRVTGANDILRKIVD